MIRGAQAQMREEDHQDETPELSDFVPQDISDKMYPYVRECLQCLQLFVSYPTCEEGYVEYEVLGSEL